MIKNGTQYKEILIGLAAASLPFMALAYKFGFKKTAAIFMVVVVTFLSAKIAIHLFTRRSKLAKGTAIVMQGNLLFLFFMPKALKEKMSSLEEKERESSGRAIDQDD